jgi:sugar phosphate isomerase/epimerase
VGAASDQGGVVVSQGDARRERWAHFARRLEMCKGVGIQTLVIAGDVPGPLSQVDFERLRMSLAQAAQQGGDHGVRLALEFQAHASFPNNLQSAAALVDEIA